MPCIASRQVPHLRIVLTLIIVITFFALFLAPSIGICQSKSTDIRPLTSTEQFIEGGTVKDGISIVGFETDEVGSRTTRSREKYIDNDFVFAGVKLSAIGGVGPVLCGYMFKRSLSGARAIATVEKTQRVGGEIKTHAYRGRLRVDFCSPDGNAVTVKKMGMMVEITKPRHSILSAYNVSGHRIGTCEAAEKHSSFLGFESQRPIAFAVLRANTDLEVKKLSEDFAVDDIVFGETETDAWRNLKEDAKGTLSDGKSLREFSSTIYSNIPRPENSVSVMLDCGSVVNCSINKGQLQMLSSPDVEISLERVIGIWGYNSECCYPNGSDFQNEVEAVLVTPLFRLSLKKAEIDLGDGTVKLDLSELTATYQPWDENGKAGFKKLDKDDDVKRSLVRYGVDEDGSVKLTGSQSLWFEVPPLRSEITSVLRTRDGQEFVLGDALPFSIDSVATDKVSIAHDGTKIEIPKDNVSLLIR